MAKGSKKSQNFAEHGTKIAVPPTPPIQKIAGLIKSFFPHHLLVKLWETNSRSLPSVWGWKIGFLDFYDSHRFALQSGWKTHTSEAWWKNGEFHPMGSESVKKSKKKLTKTNKNSTPKRAKAAACFCRQHRPLSTTQLTAAKRAVCWENTLNGPRALTEKKIKHLRLLMKPQKTKNVEVYVYIIKVK